LTRPPLAEGDCLIQSLSVCQIRKFSAPLKKLDNFLWRRKGQYSGKGSVQIPLQKLAMSSRGILESHIDAMEKVWHPSSIGEQTANYFHYNSRLWKASRRRGVWLQHVGALIATFPTFGLVGWISSEGRCNDDTSGLLA
jgi:hypothetical protein